MEITAIVGLGLMSGLVLSSIGGYMKNRNLLRVAKEGGVEFISGIPIVLLKESDYGLLAAESRMYQNITLSKQPYITREELAEANEEMLFADGFDEALIGFVERAGSSVLALYDTDKCIQILMERDGMTDEEATEFFYFNVAGSYMGENTPVFGTLVEEGVNRVEEVIVACAMCETYEGVIRGSEPHRAGLCGGCYYDLTDEAKREALEVDKP
jgi:hypothetical protein